MTDKEKMVDMVKEFGEWIEEQQSISNLDHAKSFLHITWDEWWWRYDSKKYSNYQDCPNVPDELYKKLEDKWQHLNKKKH